MVHGEGLARAETKISLGPDHGSLAGFAKKFELNPKGYRDVLKDLGDFSSSLEYEL